MNIQLDVHTHTVVSGHAYSTMQEMVTAAAEKGLKMLGITEHAPAIPGTCHPIYFRNIHCVPREMQGVRIMLGAELNILNTRGEIDLDEEYLRMLDLRIAGMHIVCWEGGTTDENTHGVETVMRNPYVQIISHPGDGTASLHFEHLVQVSKETHTLLEINNHSMAPVRHKAEARPNNLLLLRLAKEYRVPIILGSDAHISTMIAQYDNILPLLKETNFPEELIMNLSTERFLDYLKPMPEKPLNGKI